MRPVTPNMTMPIRCVPSRDSDLLVLLSMSDSNHCSVVRLVPARQVHGRLRARAPTARSLVARVGRRGKRGIALDRREPLTRSSLREDRPLPNGRQSGHHAPIEPIASLPAQQAMDAGPNLASVFRSSVRGRRTEIETADEIARAIERAEAVLGSGRVRYVHPDCG